MFKNSTDKKLKFYFVFFVGFLFFGLAHSASAATYYMRADGSAANKGVATSCAAASTAMNITTHNSQSGFAVGDIIMLCPDGGTYSGQITSRRSDMTYQIPNGSTVNMNNASGDVFYIQDNNITLDGSAGTLNLTGGGTHIINVITGITGYHFKNIAISSTGAYGIFANGSNTAGTSEYITGDASNAVVRINACTGLNTISHITSSGITGGVCG